MLPAEQNASPGSKPMATVNGKAITEEEVNAAAAPELEKLELQKIQAEINFKRTAYQIRESALKRIIEERLIDTEAARLGMTRKDLLNGELDQKVKEPSAEDVSAFYESNKSRITAPKEQVLPQIQQYLKQQNLNKLKDAFVERLRKEQNVTILLEDLRYQVETAGYPSRGPEQAPVTIVVFSDFQCPFCKSYTATLNRITKEFSSSVRVVYRQLPLTEIHPLAEKAAEASLCAQEQGRFWELHDQMFNEQSALAVDSLKAKAASLGLDTDAFNSCLDSGRLEQKVKKEIREGATLGVTGTPATFINGRFLNGAHPYEEVAALIREELQKKAAIPLKP
jgi:protein-disulfide isomerase